MSSSGGDIEYYESDALTQIDGYLVTDGTQVRLTIRKHLSPQDKARGKQALLERFEAERRPGVYLWSRSEDRTYYESNGTTGLENADAAGP